MESAARFFDKFAENFDSLYDGKRTVLVRWLDQHFRQDMFIRFALTFETFGDLEGKSVLDIGCGSGPYVLEALNRGARSVTAVDPAPGMLELLRQKLEGRNLAGRCSIVPGSFPGVDIDPHDHVIVMGVMDYIVDPAAFLRALRPMVKTSAALSFPSIHWFRTPIRKVRYYARRCPVYFYDRQQIARLSSDAGFRSVGIQKIAGAGMDYHVCLKP